MKLIKFLLFFSIAIGNATFAMDLEPMDIEPKKEQLPKPDLTPEQLKEERKKPKSAAELKKLTGQDVAPPTEIQKIIAQHILNLKDEENKESVLEYIGKQKPIAISQENPFFLNIPHQKNPKFLVSRAAFSPDETKLAIYYRDGSFRIWDVRTRKILKTFKDKMLGVMCMTFSPDGTEIATGNIDTIVRIWNVDTGKIKKKLKGHKGEVSCLAYSPDGTMLATGSPGDDTVHIWNVKTRKQSKTLRNQNQARVWSIAFSPDGTTIAIGCGDSLVRLWNVNTGELLNILRIDNPNPTGNPIIDHTIIYNVAFSPDRTTIAASSGAIVRIWDIKSARMLKELKNPDWLFEVVDNLATITHVNTHEPVTVSAYRERLIPGIAFNQAGTNLFVCYSNTTGTRAPILQIWNKKTDEISKESLGKRKINSIAFNPNRTKIITADYGGGASMWRIIKKNRVLQWLTNTLPGQKTFLLPDQAEIIRGMYEAHKKGQQYALTAKEANRFRLMPDTVKAILKFYFGSFIVEKESEHKIRKYFEKQETEYLEKRKQRATKELGATFKQQKQP